jgi:ribosomal protein L11 methyltransferase
VQYAELQFSVPAVAADACAAELIEAGAAGVEERDSETLERSRPGQVVLVAWVETRNLDSFLYRARATFELEKAELRIQERDDAEWRDAWKRHFSSRQIGPFVIVPSWEKYTARPGEILLALDPGRAFGTGGHASTRLCLEIIGRLGGSPRRILDFGCGSGVLSIGALRRFPEANAMGIDIDSDAIEVSRENAERNGVLARAVFSTQSIREIEDRFDLLLANIQPEVLIPMAHTLKSRLHPDGRLLLSGILVEAAPSVAAAFSTIGLELIEHRDEEGWRALLYCAR